MRDAADSWMKVRGGDADSVDFGLIDAELITRLSDLNAVPGSGRAAQTVPIPFTGQELGRVPLGTPEDVSRAVERARRAQIPWAGRPFGERADIIRRFHDLVFEQREEVLDLVQLESGKARRHAIEEVWDVALVARHYAFNGERRLRTRRRRGAFPIFTRAWESHLPWGVVGIIAPWNYPFSLAAGDAVPALLAGNATVLKPDLQTTFTALLAGALLAEAGLPDGLFEVVSGEGPELGPALIGGVDYLSFTGSTETGRRIARQAAERLLPCSLELGGKNPMLVLGDADVDAAVDGAVRG
ncbi:MAG: aldehyde dehydrogenase family protein, partial [Gemmatimonadales bacterium]